MITDNPAYFTADGSTLLIQSVSRINSITDEKVVGGFLIDFDQGATYSLPSNFSANSKKINADASSCSVYLNFPECNLLIGKR